ncbi:MAG TPA: phage major capsid protein [Methylophilus sp.]|uniref:phage major capsid protein n=1 Tax=Methylophilus sp. TaxID=29541 RepID=UPI002D01E641|nr:phage major capsid protein [Methylophilus sp.]HSH86882.1 phage major capsid protein [Methylophilus sp.]
MSNTLKALREQKQEKSRLANKLLADNGDKIWSKESQAEFDGLADDITRIDAQIDAHQKMVDDTALNNFADADKHRAEKPAKAQVSDGVRAMNILLRNQTRNISVEDMQLIQNTMSTTTGSEGGYTVPSEIASTVIETLKDFGAMRRNATKLVTSDGRPLSYPTSDGTAEEGEIVAENTSATDADIVFGTVGLNCFKFGSKVITIPIELLQDTNVDVLSLINTRVRDRIGRIQNRLFTVGTGTGQPNGIVTASTVGKTGTTGQTVTVTYDDLVDLVDSIDIAYHEAGSALKFMLSQTSRRVARKIKDTAGRPIWTPSYDLGMSARTPDLLLGYELEINNNMPAPGANNKSIGFGDISKYIIRDAMDISLFKFEDSAFIKKGQIGFLAWARSGGNMPDANAFKVYQHSAT